ncbi:transmembrane channel-like protein 7 [Cimex lectularius]|uniref:TMC domain-containing protein n=1 Tax=Cimex lectularius TaxID=79782 RepID=A0A8I6S8L9_CIMLE|nr:transmembrane channel-like protein 7 [Cimex lectularius]
MSGGERKKRIARGTGWEEAGGEFYQESYPGGEIDLEALPRDPHYFATLLPSKQNRAATTRKPQKADPKATFKRRTSTRSRYYNTMGQNTIPNDIHVAMMPDLSENLANEETTWEEMMLIKAMPISMAQKKEIKAKLLSADTFRLQGLKHFKWRRRKFWEYMKIKKKEYYKTIQLWRKCLRAIEGNFGTGVVAFFFFIKWLMFLNLTITVLIVCFIIVPTLLMKETENDPCMPSNGTISVACCSQLYSNNLSDFVFDPYDFAQGTGWVERSYMFYGVYSSSILEDTLLNYNLPVAYIATALGYFLLSLFAILKAAANGFKERLVESDGQYYRYCNMIFSGWDFCIYNEKSASIKHKGLFYELKDSLEYERREDDKKNRSRDEYCRLISIRIFINMIVIIILIASGSLIFFTFQFSLKELELHRDNQTEYYRLLLEFIPSLCIVGLNLIIPNILNYLVSLENYSPIFVVRITLFRTILLRLSSLGVLLASFYSLVKCRVGTEEACASTYCRTPLCWETYVGQQLYKLIILDIVSNAIVTFLINFPRMLIAKHIKCKLARILGAQEFELPKHVLDVVYSQTLVWFGSFYAPLLPALATVLFFLVFYIKKFACLVNSSPSTTIYRASRSNSMFMSVLLVSFSVAVIPWAYTMSEIEPSRSCGPFRGRPSVWSLVEETYQEFPCWLKNTFSSVTSAYFLIPAFSLLSFSLYYYYIIAKENKQMVTVLKKQLVLEGHDKQFLLDRLSAFIKQHQERHKAARSIDPPIIPHNSVNGAHGNV